MSSLAADGASFRDVAESLDLARPRPHVSHVTWARLAAALLGALAALQPVGLGRIAAADAPSPGGLRGTYRLHGTARVAATPLPERDLELHADALLEPGSSPRQVRIRVAAEGYACDLVARLDDAGALAFEPGQRCLVALASPGARGRVEATLRSGRGQLADDHLALELACDLAGSVSLKAGGGRVLGAEVPATWMPPVPVQGEARAAAEGDRDRSRAAP
jgi:hypothetical protein